MSGERSQPRCTRQLLQAQPSGGKLPHHRGRGSFKLPVPICYAPIPHRCSSLVRRSSGECRPAVQSPFATIPRLIGHREVLIIGRRSAAGISPACLAKRCRITMLRNRTMEYTFTLKYQLAEDNRDPEELVERLGEAGCDDALVGIGRSGRLALEFTRDAPDAAKAVLSALGDVRRAVPSAKLIHP